VQETSIGDKVAKELRSGSFVHKSASPVARNFRVQIWDGNNEGER
jgi:hypothetical protein